jgi:hypothetical protein
MLEGVVIDDTELFNEKLQEWEDFYNFVHTELSAARLRTRGFARRRGPGRERTPSAAQLARPATAELPEGRVTQPPARCSFEVADLGREPRLNEHRIRLMDSAGEWRRLAHQRGQPLLKDGSNVCGKP